MTAAIKLSAVLAKSWLIGFVALSLSAQADEAQQIAADGSSAMLGKPSFLSPQMALADKPLMLTWESAAGDQEMTEVQVARITHTRRVIVTTDEARKADKQWSWNWTPPKTRAVVHYEVRLKALPDVPIILEIHDAQWLDGLRKAFDGMDVGAEGLTDDELGALKQAGIHSVSNHRSRDGQDAHLQLTSSDPANSRRQVTWDTEHHDLVVWRPGPATGDVMIRAPRWWISAEALSTDHGVIRLFKLLSEPPVAP